MIYFINGVHINQCVQMQVMIISLKGDMIALFKYLKGCHTEEGQDLFSIIPECRTCNNGLKLKEARFQLNIRKNFLLEQYNSGTSYLGNL